MRVRMDDVESLRGETLGFEIALEPNERITKGIRELSIGRVVSVHDRRAAMVSSTADGLAHDTEHRHRIVAIDIDLRNLGSGIVEAIREENGDQRPAPLVRFMQQFLHRRRIKPIFWEDSHDDARSSPMSFHTRLANKRRVERNNLCAPGRDGIQGSTVSRCGENIRAVENDGRRNGSRFADDRNEIS